MALLVGVFGRAGADEMCQGSRPVDPRNSRLDVLEININQAGIAGWIKNSSDKTAVGVMVWVNYFRSARGGLIGQQCIPIGDLTAGERRPFRASQSVKASEAESWTHAAEALDWK